MKYRTACYHLCHTRKGVKREVYVTVYRFACICVRNPTRMYRKLMPFISAWGEGTSAGGVGIGDLSLDAFLLFGFSIM